MEPLCWYSTLLLYLKTFGWAVVASVSFAFGVGLAIKIFDWLSVSIDEWEEIRKGNIGVALIFVSMILMIGLLIFKVLSMTSW